MTVSVVRYALVCAVALSFLLSGCGGPQEAEARGSGLTLRSSVMREGGDVPRRFTCDGENTSPPLSWDGAPKGTRSFAVIVEDPDAPHGTFIHWVLYDVPPGRGELPAGQPKLERLSDGGVQGENDFGRVGYDGPCPPPGRAHRYVFQLYALDASTGLEPGIDAAHLERAMEGHVLARATLTARFGR